MSGQPLLADHVLREANHYIRLLSVIVEPRRWENDAVQRIVG